MPERFFFEQVADNKKESYKIFFVLMVIVTALGGIVFYFVYTEQVDKTPTFLETRCGFKEVRESVIGDKAKDVGGVRSQIEQKVGESNLQYLSLKPTEQCDNDVGMWFSNLNGSSMYAYCLGVSSGRMVEFQMIDCRTLDHNKAVETSIETVVNATRGK